MSDPRPLYIVGSKRSGSSLFVSLLNYHPRVLVTHESDVVWILYGGGPNRVPFEDPYRLARVAMGPDTDLQKELG